MQAYNAQTVITESQIILAAEVTRDANDRNLLKPMVDAARADLDAIEFDGKVRAALADGDCWNSDQIEQLRPPRPRSYGLST